MRISRIAAAMGIAAVCSSALGAGVDINSFIKKERFHDVKISPAGDYYAATAPLEDKTALVILRRSDNKVMTSFMLGKDTYVDDFSWVSPERVLISMAEKFGALDKPQRTGEMYGVDADGGKLEFLVGQRVTDAGLGTKIKPKKVEEVAATLIDDLPNDDKNVLVAISSFDASPFTRVDRMDVYNGHRTTVARAPVRNATFVTDNHGVVRFAYGANYDTSTKLFYREGEGKEWRQLNDQTTDGRDEFAIGFSADDRTAYLQVGQPNGPDAIVAMDVATNSIKQVLRDRVADPGEIIYRNGTQIPLGALFTNDVPKIQFLDDAAPEARLQRSLEAAFAGSTVRITSQTTNGSIAVVEVKSDRNPGDYYAFDTVGKKAALLFSARDWLDPEAMSESKPVVIKARDGLDLHGYLTLPKGSNGKNLPTIVYPHGGPIGVADGWLFDDDVQMLSAAGYAVLRVNYRGSSGYGRSFLEAGARQWGGTMQDDLTDATRWVAANGYADPSRICIYGASYGGYAALMGAAKEPGLYKCAIGYVGVYDLPMMQSDDSHEGTWAKTWSHEWVGDTTQIAAVSPTRLASRIKVPVFLAAGGEDKTAPLEHSKRMEKALHDAGVPVETLYVKTEGHGFYTEEHKRDFYTRLLAFLNRNIGGGIASTAPAPAVGSAAAPSK